MRMAEDSPRIMEDDRDDVEALKEQHAQWLEDLDGKLKKPCCCKKKGCMEFRKRYRYGAAMMRFSSKKFPEARLRRHLLCLKLDPDVLPRCQAVSNHNVQCKHAALWGTEYCQHHKRIDQRKEVVE